MTKSQYTDATFMCVSCVASRKAYCITVVTVTNSTMVLALAIGSVYTEDIQILAFAAQLSIIR